LILYHLCLLGTEAVQVVSV